MFQGKPAVPDVSASARIFIAFLLAFIVVTRWLLAPHRLYYFDSGNFALALDHFNPALHQPQPPGYPLFVALSKIIYIWVARPERVFLIAGLLGACAATLLVRILAADLFGRAAGLLAAALLASNPVFWFGGLTNQIRIFLAVSALGVALLSWRAVTRPASPGWFYAVFGALGIAGGFRPVEATLLVPVVLWAWWQTGRGFRRLALGAAVTALTALPWLAATVIAAGGPLRFVGIIHDYAQDQFQGTSAVYGATRQAAYGMVAEAFVWNFFGSLAWIWAVPLVIRHSWGPGAGRKFQLLALGFLPPFLFSSIIHIGDPDQALASVSILCVFGGGALAAVLERFGSRRVFTLACAMIVVHTVLFFKPPSKLARAASYKAVAEVDGMNRTALNAIQSLRRDGPLTIVDWGSSVAWRHLQYYFPDDYVVVLPGDPSIPASPGASSIMVYHREGMDAPQGAAGWIRPGTRRIVCLVPVDVTSPEFSSWHHLGNAYYSLYYRDYSGSRSIRIGSFTLISPKDTETFVPPSALNRM